MNNDDDFNTPPSYGRRTGRSRVFTSPFRSPTQISVHNVVNNIGGSPPGRILSNDRAPRLWQSIKPRYAARMGGKPRIGMSPVNQSIDRWAPASPNRPSHVLYDDSIDSWYDHQSPVASTGAAHRSTSFSVLSQAALAPITALIHNRSVVDASHEVDVASPYHRHGQKNHLAPIESAFCAAMGIIAHTSTSQRGKHFHATSSRPVDEHAFLHNGIECVGGEDVALLEQIPDIPLAQRPQRLSVHGDMSLQSHPAARRSHRRRSVVAATPPRNSNVRTRSQSAATMTPQHSAKTERLSTALGAESQTRTTQTGIAEVSHVARQEQLLRSMDGFYCDEEGSPGMTNDTAAAGVVFLATDVALARTDSSEDPLSGVVSISTAVLAGTERLTGVGRGRGRHRGVSAHIIAAEGVAAMRTGTGTGTRMKVAGGTTSEIVAMRRVETSLHMSTFSSPSSSLSETREGDMAPGDATLRTPTATRVRSHAATDTVTDTATASPPRTPRTRASSPLLTTPTPSPYTSAATSRSTKRNRRAMEEVGDMDDEADRRDRWERRTPTNATLLLTRGGSQAHRSALALVEVAVDAPLSTPRSDGFISASALLAASRSASNASSSRGYGPSSTYASLPVAGLGTRTTSPRTLGCTPTHSATAYAATPSSTTPYHTSHSVPAPITAPTRTPTSAASPSLPTPQPRGPVTQPSIDHLLQNRPTIPLPPPPPNPLHRGPPTPPSPSPHTPPDGFAHPDSRASMPAHMAADTHTRPAGRVALAHAPLSRACSCDAGALSPCSHAAGRAADTSASHHPSRTTAARAAASTSAPSRALPSLPPPPPSAALSLPAPVPVPVPTPHRSAPVSPLPHPPTSCPLPPGHLPLLSPPPSLPPPLPPHPATFPPSSAHALPLSPPHLHAHPPSPHPDSHAGAHTHTHAHAHSIATPASTAAQPSFASPPRPSAHTTSPALLAPHHHTPTTTTTHAPAPPTPGPVVPATPTSFPTPVTVLPLSPLSARQRTRARARRDADMIACMDSLADGMHSSACADARASAAAGPVVHGPDGVEAGGRGSRAAAAPAGGRVWDGKGGGARGVAGEQRQSQEEGCEALHDGEGMEAPHTASCPQAMPTPCSNSSGSSGSNNDVRPATTGSPNVLITPARRRRDPASSTGFTPSSNNSTTNAPAMSPSTPAFRFSFLAPTTPPPVARSRAVHSPTHATSSTTTPSSPTATATTISTATITPFIPPSSSAFTPRIEPPRHPHALSSPDPFRFLSPVQSPVRTARNAAQSSKPSHSVAPSQPLRTPLGPPAPILPTQEVVSSRAALPGVPSHCLSFTHHSRVLATNSIYAPDVVSTNLTFDPASAPTPMLTDGNVMNSPPRSPLIFSPFSPASVLASPTPLDPLYSVFPVALYQAPLPDDYYLNLLAWQPSRFLALAHGTHVSILAPPHPESVKKIQFAMNTRISSLAWSSDSVLHIGARDGHVMTVDLETDSVVRVDRAHTARVGTMQSCPQSPHLLLSGGADCALVITDLRAPPATPWSAVARNESSGIFSPASIPSVAYFFLGHLQEVCGASWSAANPNLIASGSNDNHVGIWDLRRGMWMRRVHRAGVKALAWHEDMLITAGGTHDKRVLLWKYGAGFIGTHVPTDAELNLFEPDAFDNRAEVGRGGAMLGPLSFQGEVNAASQVCGVVWVGDVPVTSHGYSQNCIMTWTTRPLAIRTRVTAHDRRALFIAGDGKSLVATGAGDATVKVWRIGENRDVTGVGAGIGGHHTGNGGDTRVDRGREKASLGCSLQLR